MTTLKHYLMGLATLLGVMACAVQHPEITEREKPADFPDAFYQQAAENGKTVYQIDPAKSQVIIYAYRGGALANLGHDHVIASHQVSGYILQDDIASQADIFVPLNLLRVDEANLRAAAGLMTQPTSADIEGTRQHMLQSVLETQQYPFARLHVDQLINIGNATAARTTLTLHGVTHVIEIPLIIQTMTDTQLALAGNFSIKQTDFGITPYAVMGGLLQVQDNLKVQFQIVASTLYQ